MALSLSPSVSQLALGEEDTREKARKTGRPLGAKLSGLSREEDSKERGSLDRLYRTYTEGFEDKKHDNDQAEAGTSVFFFFGVLGWIFMKTDTNKTKRQETKGLSLPSLEKKANGSKDARISLFPVCLSRSASPRPSRADFVDRR